jgi:hypothetical protein
MAISPVHLISTLLGCEEVINDDTYMWGRYGTGTIV